MRSIHTIGRTRTSRRHRLLAKAVSFHAKETWSCSRAGLCIVSRAKVVWISASRGRSTLRAVLSLGGAPSTNTTPPTNHGRALAVRSTDRASPGIGHFPSNLHTTCGTTMSGPSGDGVQVWKRLLQGGEESIQPGHSWSQRSDTWGHQRTVAFMQLAL